MTLADLYHQALWTAAWATAPFLGVALAVGLLMSLLQAATQMQENAIAFVPKLAATLLAVAVFGPWVLDRLTHFGKQALSMPAAPVERLDP